MHTLFMNIFCTIYFKPLKFTLKAYILQYPSVSSSVLLYPPVSWLNLSDTCCILLYPGLPQRYGCILYPSVSFRSILKVRMHAVSFCILVYLKGNGYMLYPPVSRFTLKVRIHAVFSCIQVYLEGTDTCCILLYPGLP